jgi:hypothetical protein
VGKGDYTVFSYLISGNFHKIKTLGTVQIPRVFNGDPSEGRTPDTLIERQWAMSNDRIKTALALLAVSGKLGYDAHDRAYFHRELPDDPDRF